MSSVQGSYSEEDYFNSRLCYQIDWYGSKSQRAQKLFKKLKALEIIAAAIIPIVAVFGGHYDISVNIYVAILGTLVAIAAAFTSLNKLQENWTEYRVTCEALKREKFLYLTKTTPYNGDEAFHCLVKRVEAIMADENSNWVDLTPTNVENEQPKIV
jgi:uncharacterized membrane protein YqaE (UPF0057 family)